MSGTSQQTPSGHRRSTKLLSRATTSLIVLLLLAVTLQSLVFSGANFLDSESTTSASFLAGSISHTNSASGSFVLQADPIWAGGTKTGQLTILGGADVPAAYSLSLLSVSDVPATPAFSSVLRLRVDDLTGGTNIYDGVASGFTTANLGVIAPGQSRQIGFAVTYPAASATRALMGAMTTLQFEFEGVSP